MHRYRQADIVWKWSNHVQDISKHGNPSKTLSRKFSRIQYFLLMYIEESKNALLKKYTELLSDNSFYCNNIDILWYGRMI